MVTIYHIQKMGGKGAGNLETTLLSYRKELKKLGIIKPSEEN